ncbi:hypothetical protein [Streptomyces sp. NBC_01314]|uniref:hypothetical protein n=1 Tax=Streptomyces sp. NBC_01314 TaxID=2903821 RepID=UPI00308E5176|nr:hypothetical protein OG622_37340 [Streptomyces sp. NBC_01314]
MRSLCRRTRPAGHRLGRGAARFADGKYLDTGPARLPQWMVALDHRREPGVPEKVFTDATPPCTSATWWADLRDETGPAPDRGGADVHGHVPEFLGPAGHPVGRPPGATGRQVRAERVRR